MQSEPARELHVGYSIIKSLGFTLLGAGMTYLSAAIAFHQLQNISVGAFGELFGYVGTLVFGAATCFNLWRVATSRRDIVVLTDAGLLDTRVTKGPVPWPAIRAVKPWRFRSLRAILIDADPKVIESLSRRAKSRPDSISIVCNGLNISQKDLVDAINARVATAPAGGN